MMKTNPKALNLDAVRLAESNVTIGFKCYPAMKLLLAKEAKNAGLTLSSYVCKLVDFEINEINKLRQENETLNFSLKKTKSLLAFYRNQLLFDLFDLHKGKEIVYFSKDGKKINQKIDTIEDIYLVIINSFKYKA